MPGATTTAPTHHHVALIGGGIGGLCMAVSLARHQVPFHLYEAAHAFAEIGAGVALHRTAVAAMERIDPAIREGFERVVTYNGDPERKNTWFQFRWAMEPRNKAVAAHSPAASADGPPPQAGEMFAWLDREDSGLAACHRAHFLNELIKLVPQDCVTFGSKLESLHDDGKKVEMRFENGTVATAEAVIGCDGIKSHVRESILGPTYNAQFSGKYAYRGLLDMETAAGLLGDAVARNSQMHSGYGGHILHMPVEHGKTMNVVAFQTKEDGKWEDERWVLPMDWKAMNEDFAGWGDNVKKILSLMQKPDVWALFNHPHAPTFYKGRVALMGDAAHASTPHQGSGAGFAIVDAYVLGDVLGQVTKPEQFPAAFRAYDEVRRPLCHKLVDTSREAGKMWDFEAPDIGDDPIKFHTNLQWRLDWIFHEDIDAEAKEIRHKFADLVAVLK